MPHFDESFARLAAYPLRGRICRYQRRMLAFELFQLPHQRVKFRIADLRTIQNVIKMFVMTDFVPQAFDFFCSVAQGRHRKKIIGKTVRPPNFPDLKPRPYADPLRLYLHSSNRQILPIWLDKPRGGCL